MIFENSAYGKGTLTNESIVEVNEDVEYEVVPDPHSRQRQMTLKCIKILPMLKPGLITSYIASTNFVLCITHTFWLYT